jgi:hypothetical protein
LGVSFELLLVPIIYCGFALAVVLIRIILKRKLTTTFTGALLPAAAASGTLPGELRPAEIAYLMRPGDMGHTLIVMTLDLIQRALKRQAGNLPPAAAYEANLWEKVKEYTETRAREQFAKLVPPASPVGWFKRLTSLYKMFGGGSMQKFIQQVIADPKRIKRYFSLPGIARLIADFYSAGYQNLVEMELKASLLNRGLLTDDITRQRAASAFLLFAVASLVMLVGLSYWLMPNAVATSGVLICGALTAAILRLLHFVRELIPYYSELNDILRMVHRPGIRLRLLRLVLGVVRGIIYGALIVSGLILLGATVALLHLVLAMPISAAFLLAITSTIAWLPIAQVIADWYHMKWHPQPTNMGERLVDNRSKELSTLSPLQSLRNMLASEQYDPVFCELLAMYGIETLWILI